MSWLLLALSVLLGVCKSSVYNVYAKRSNPDVSGILQFNTISYGMALLVVLFSGSIRSVSSLTVIAAVAYAIIVFSLQALSVKAMTVGPMSLTSLMVIYGMIIPALAGPIFWKEPVSILQIVGMLLMILTIPLLRKKDEKNYGMDAKWWILAVICFLLSGGAGLMEKIHQTSPYREERTAFLLTAFLIMFAVSGVGMVCMKVRKKQKISWMTNTLILGGVTGLIIGFYNRINLILSGTLDSIVYYPIANGGGLLLIVLVSLAVFREKLPRRMILGLGIGLMSILLLSLQI